MNQLSKKIIVLIFCFVSFSYLQSQTKKVLFLGNSYTYVNDLPLMISDIAASAGDNLTYDSNTPGGYTLQLHSTNSTSVSKIAQGNWDYVVLQEQSQLPSFPDSQVNTDVYPYAHILDSLITAANPCTETVFFMTWGRKNGDATNCANWPPVCTYEGMDSLLSLRYRIMADSNNAILSPAGAVWKYIRQNYPLIDLYQSDESHPSVAGTYAAACCFYTVLFRKDPLLITYNSSLSPSDASDIRNAVKNVVFNNLAHWFVGTYDPSAQFNFICNANQISFTNLSVNAINYIWNFGDGNTSTAINPVHYYINQGNYNVNLTARKCGMENSSSQIINIISTSDDYIQNTDNDFTIFPNPSESEINVIFNKNKEKDSEYIIFNQSGAMVKSGKIDKNQNLINISDLNKGTYLLQIQTKKQKSNIKSFIIN